MAEEIQSLPDIPEIVIKNGKVIEVDAPKPPYVNDAPTPGNPTISSGARSVIADTAINASNESLTHVCDFVSDMQKNIQLKEFIKSQAQNIRKAIRAVLRALGFSDATGQASWFANTLKSIAREVDYVNKEILQPIINFEKVAIAYVAKLREIVTWILSLPAKFLAVLQDCLARTLKLIGNVFTDIGAGLSEGFSSGGDGDFSSVIKEAKALVNTASNTIKLATTAAAGAANVVGAATIGLLVPTTQAELDAANKEIASYKTNDVFPGQNKNQP